MIVLCLHQGVAYDRSGHYTYAFISVAGVFCVAIIAFAAGWPPEGIYKAEAAAKEEDREAEPRGGVVGGGEVEDALRR